MKDVWHIRHDDSIQRIWPNYHPPFRSCRSAFRSSCYRYRFLRIPAILCRLRSIGLDRAGTRLNTSHHLARCPRPDLCLNPCRRRCILPNYRQSFRSCTFPSQTSCYRCRLPHIPAIFSRPVSIGLDQVPGSHQSWHITWPCPLSPP